MKALILKAQGDLTLGEIAQPQPPAADEVRIAIRNVGICGSDVHYYTHGRIGPYVVEAPMVLGHEASGVVTQVGANVTHLAVGDRVCMEPGIPDMNSRATKLGVYNLDPKVRFWATPPIDGCLTEEVNHPAAFSYKLPDDVSFAEGAMVEPLATGMQAAKKARITPGDTALVTGAGTIGILTALAALAGGCGKVIISDISQAKLDIAATYDGLIPVNIRDTDLLEVVKRETDGWGVDCVFEASGSEHVYPNIFDYLCPDGCLVIVGILLTPVPLDLVAAQSKEIRMETVFRYANVFDRALALMASGKINVKPLISQVFPFEESIQAYERAARGEAGDVKLQITL